MISHIYIGVNDFTAAFDFYSAVMHDLGLDLTFTDPEKPWAAWVSPASPRPLFLIGKPYNGEDAHAGNGQMVALLALSRDAVTKAYATARSLGGTCEGRPGLRPEYHDHYFGAYFRDLDGNKICICCHDAP